jgi:hypothetical protein
VYLQRATRLLAGGIFCAAAALAQAPPPAAPPAPPSAAQPAALPEAPYVPLTNRQKFRHFARQTVAPHTFISAAFDATYEQMTGDPYEYGGGMEGFGKRFGTALADTEASRFFGRFMFPALFHQDPRYFPAKPHTAVPRRAWYAATRTVITRADAGQSQFNYSEMLGALFTVGLTNAYYPERARTFGGNMNRFEGALISNTLSNVTREFWPEIKRLFRRHEPKRIEKIQEKIEKKIPPSVRDAVSPPDDSRP